MKLFRKKIDYSKISPEELIMKSCFVIFGTFLSAVTFNLFYAPNNLVIGGTTGLSLIMNDKFNIEPAFFVFLCSIVLVVLSFTLLGKKITLKTLICAFLSPLFIKLTANISSIINVETNSMLLICIFGGVLGGLSSGIVLKNGFSMGGIQILCQIMKKYLNISIGKASLIINGIIILSASFIFGIDKTLYAVLALYIDSYITDKVILGISRNKAFYIITSREQEIRKVILNNLDCGVTIINVIKGKGNEETKMLLCILPTRKYFILKETIKEIDNKAFFLVTDAYEVYSKT